MSWSQKQLHALLRVSRSEIVHLFTPDGDWKVIVPLNAPPSKVTFSFLSDAVCWKVTELPIFFTVAVPVKEVPAHEHNWYSPVFELPRNLTDGLASSCKQ